MTSRVERWLNVVLTAAAVCIAGVLVYREVRPRQTVAFDQELLHAAQFREWNQALALSRLSGSPAATLQVVVFSDLECPGCRAFHSLSRTMQQKDSLSLALRLIPFSLPQHRFAAPAARLLECAGQAGHYDAMLDALYASQDSLGLKAWGAMAEDAGWHAGPQADRCAKNNESIPYLKEAMEFGERVGVRATPTVVVNGLRLNRVPTLAELLEARDRVRGGRAPFDATMQP